MPNNSTVLVFMNSKLMGVRRTLVGLRRGLEQEIDESGREFLRTKIQENVEELQRLKNDVTDLDPEFVISDENKDSSEDGGEFGEDEQTPKEENAEEKD